MYESSERAVNQEGASHDWKRQLEKSDVWKGRERPEERKSVPESQQEKANAEEPKSILTNPIPNKPKPDEKSDKERTNQSGDENSKKADNSDNESRVKNTEPAREHAVSGGYLALGAAAAGAMLAIGYLTYEEYRSAMDNIDRFKRATDNEYGESKTAEERGKLEKPESTKDSPATKAQKDEIVKLLHKRELSWDPDKEKFVPEEGEIGAFIEERFNIILERSPRGKGDFYNPKSGYEYDLVGPTSATAKGKYKVHNVIRQIINHLRYDKTVVVLSNLSVEDKKIVLEFINSLDKTDLNKIILIDKM